ncbi:MAG: DUF4258 domain-containing protein [Deltaproteobacteria bacterium]|nr:DUF4258 domain-containing protein [Deltaproteobacteria bacterium]
MEEIIIQFSRHAKRRMALYEISEPTVRAIIKSRKKDGIVKEGKNEVIDYQTLNRHGYPVKVVFVYKENHITVITAYPLRRGIK